MDSRTQHYFDQHAAQFDSIYHEAQPLQRALNRTFRKAIYERFAITFEQSDPIAGKTVLDIGCGSGRYAVEFARLGAARVVGVDYAPGMLSLAREYAQASGVGAQCEFIQGDFTAQVIDQQFDVVIAIGVFDYQHKPVEFMRKMVQHGRGRIIATFPGRSLIRMPLRKLRYWFGNCPVLFYREDEVREIGRQAGLRTVKIIPIHSSGTGFVLVGDV
jgi:2-polyprenyl-3-methyl-5-hydroxy-6-metoxy-1,4-benzoquinol methylase